MYWLFIKHNNRQLSSTASFQPETRESCIPRQMWESTFSCFLAPSRGPPERRCTWGGFVVPAFHPPPRQSAFCHCIWSGPPGHYTLDIGFFRLLGIAVTESLCGFASSFYEDPFKTFWNLSLLLFLRTFSSIALGVLFIESYWDSFSGKTLFTVKQLVSLLFILRIL